ncbi:serine hydrolase [Devosia sp.]|uniref:serine hydrolase n=1 Tax=Devosia sp. TaxID=1871048 RepID=UPI003A8E3DA5
MRIRLSIAAALVLAMSAPVAAGQAEVTALKSVFSGDRPVSELFASSFLAEVPPEQISRLADELKATIGPVVSVTQRSANTYLIRTATHEVPVDMVLDDEGRIIGLLLQPAMTVAADHTVILDQLRQAAPQVSFLVTRDGETLYAEDPDAAMAVGSAFKLGVLKVLNDEIAAGKRNWNDVIALTDADRSLPSGIVQNWPAGSPITLHSLAALMISLSDNTATDTLMRVVGRDAVAAALGTANVLTTREFFVLKADDALRRRYLAADAGSMPSVLADIAAAPLPTEGQVGQPHQQGVEFYVPVQRLCALIDALADLDVMQINPGVADRATWQRVAFKGGSETGVMNLTTATLGHDGHRYCVSATFNGPAALDRSAVSRAYASLVRLLANPAD